MNFPTVSIISGSQSATGAFNKIQVLAFDSGSADYFIPAKITHLKDGNGNYVVSGSNMFIPAGSSLDLIFTYITLGAGSAPVLLS